MKSQKPKTFVAYEIRKSLKSVLFNLPRADHGRGEKINLNFFFTFLCGALKGFMKALNMPQKTLLKP